MPVPKMRPCPHCGAGVIPTHRSTKLTPRHPFACPSCHRLVHRAWSHLCEFVSSLLLDRGSQLAAMTGSLLYALLLGPALELALICAAWLVLSGFMARALERRWPLRADAQPDRAPASG